eukprot:5820147-Pyramimonas_sp.AAC.1
MVWDFTCFPTDLVPSDVARHFLFSRRKGGGSGGTYVPALHIDQFHIRNDQIAHLPVNTTTATVRRNVTSLLPYRHLRPISNGLFRLALLTLASDWQMPLELSLGPLSIGWWRMYASLQ